MPTDPKITIDPKAGTLTIVLPLKEKPVLSKSEKSYTIATTNGNMRTAETYKGNPVTIGVNCYYPNPDR